MPATDPHGLLGQTLADKYVVESVVGAGGFATVYRAQHVIWQRPVALKVFNLLGDTTHQEQKNLVAVFLREGAILAQLSERSSAICQARDAATLTTPRGTTLPYLVLEWLDGVTLFDLLAVESARGRARRGVAQAVKLLDPIAKALVLAHQCGIVHRDVKPDNIFVLSEPSDVQSGLKLLDFGVAKVLASAAGTAAMRATLGTFTAFTPAYAAPEQFARAHGETGPWTDAYALALILVEIVAGRGAQEGLDVASIAAIAMNPTRRPTPRALGVGVTDEVEAVFTQALAVGPRERFTDVASLWTALHAAIGFEAFVPPSWPGSSVKVTVASAIHSAPTEDPPIDVREVASGSRVSTSSVPHPRRRWATRPWLAAALLTFPGILGLYALGRPLLREGWADGPKLAESPTPPPIAVTAATVRDGPPCPEGMVAIPGGTFFMGSDEGTKLERPAHKVHVAPYCIDTYEVTVSRYKACSDAGDCKRAATSNAWRGLDGPQRASFDPLCNIRDVDGRAQHPVNCVDWEMASGFCHAHEGRLPTEAEWEFAARGPDGRIYPWGDAPPGPGLVNACGSECEAWGRKHGQDERAMYAADDGWPTTAPVGSFPRGASRYGLQDVVGNVWEWVDDSFALYPSGASEGTDGAAVDERSSGTEKVIRGGAWNGADPAWVRPTFRYKAAPGTRSYGTGFRCAASVRAHSSPPAKSPQSG